MGSSHLYIAGRLTAWLTLICCIVAALVIGALVIGKMHPPRSIKHRPGVHSSTQQVDRNATSSASTAASSAAPDFANA